MVRLLHLTLSPPTSVTAAVAGSFTEADRHEIVAVRGGRHLELLRTDPKTGTLQSIHREDAFGSIRAVAALRLDGQATDHVVLTSDSGRLTFVSCADGRFQRVSCETYGKSGVRRSTPGQFLAVDPKGRAVMVAAPEREKLVFVTNRAADALTVASPLDAHKSRTLTYDVVGLYVEWENPMFAALETALPEEEGGAREEDEGREDRLLQQQRANKAISLTKEVCFYELDLGLNTVIRKAVVAVPESANALIAVPGGGVLVCSADCVSHYQIDKPSLHASIPRRATESEFSASQGVLISTHSSLRSRKGFFAMAQTERGDLFKITLSQSPDNARTEEVSIKYFDTVPPSSQLVITPNGYLFAPGESGDHSLYMFTGMAEDDDGAAATSGPAMPTGPAFTLAPRATSLNLRLKDTLPSSAPIVDMNVLPPSASTGAWAQIHALCGKSARSTFRTLRQGLALADIAVSRLPTLAAPTSTSASSNSFGPSVGYRGVWTVRDSTTKATKLIVTSYSDKTLALSVDDVVQVTTTSGIATETPTLALSAWGPRGQIVQVTPSGFRRIFNGEVVYEWKSGIGGARVEHACANEKQLVVALNNGQVVYFEAGGANGDDSSETTRYDMRNDIACLDCSSRFLAVGLYDHTVSVLSLDRANLMAQLSSQTQPSRPLSVCITSAGRLDVGMGDGTLVRVSLDPSNGEIVAAQTLLLGSDPVMVTKTTLQVPNPKSKSAEAYTTEDVTICLSSKPWIARPRHGLTLLSYARVDFVAPFATTSVTNGLVFVSGGTVSNKVVSAPALRIVELEGHLGDRLNVTSFFTERSPRRMVKHPYSATTTILLEGDHHVARGPSEAAGTASSAAEAPRVKRVKQASSDEMDLDEEDESGAAAAAAPNPAATPLAPADPEDAARVLGYPHRPHKWAACIRAVNPLTGIASQRIELDEDEMGVSMCVVSFANKGQFLVVGTVTAMKLHPRKHRACHLRTYAFLKESTQLRLVHKTEVDGVPTSVIPYDQRLLAGVGTSLRLYDLGMKQLLQKCELRNLPSLPVFIREDPTDHKLVVGDAMESACCVKYDARENVLHVFADDVHSRPLTHANELLDDRTVAVGDKFGNICVLRLPDGATGDDAKSRASRMGKTTLWDNAGALSGAPHKLLTECHFHVGEIVTGLCKTKLVPTRKETLVYGTVMGTIGSLTPFDSADELDFFGLLELHMRAKNVSLVGRDALQYRSYYAPVRHVVDGDLCERFKDLDKSAQVSIAKEMDLSVADICKRLDEARASVMW